VVAVRHKPQLLQVFDSESNTANRKNSQLSLADRVKSAAIVGKTRPAKENTQNVHFSWKSN